MDAQVGLGSIAREFRCLLEPWTRRHNRRRGEQALGQPDDGRLVLVVAHPEVVGIDDEQARIGRIPHLLGSGDVADLSAPSFIGNIKRYFNYWPATNKKGRPKAALSSDAVQSLPILHRQDMDRARGAQADDVRLAGLRAFHLAILRAFIFSQMPHDFADVGDAGRAQRMTLAEQSARDVDRRNPPRSGCTPPFLSMNSPAVPFSHRNRFS